MSWFSLSVQGKEIYDTHSSISQLFTGTYISKKFFDSVVNESPMNLTVKEAVVNQLNSWIAPSLEPASQQAAESILQATFTKKKLAYLTIKLKDHLLKGGNFGKITKHGALIALYAAKNLAKKIPNPFDQNPALLDAPMDPMNAMAFRFRGNYGKEERAEVLEYLRTGQVSKAVKLHMLYSLMPTCQQAVQKTLESMTKAAASEAYDFTLKKVCAVVLMPFIYSLALTGLESVGGYYQVPAVSYLDYLPNPSTLLGVSAAGNAMVMAKTVWNECTKVPERIDLDKEEFKKAAVKHAKENVAKKVRENELLSQLGQVQKEEDLDRLVSHLISEVVDFYWNDLHETKILSLPLVS